MSRTVKYFTKQSKLFYEIIIWNVVRDFVTFFSFIKLGCKNNTFFTFIKLSFPKIILPSYIESFLSSKRSTFYYVYVLSIKFYSIKIILYCRIVLFSILKLYDDRKYFILTIHFYNEKKVMYKESIMFPKKSFGKLML